MELNFISLVAVFAASGLAAMGLGGGSILLLYLSLATSLSQPTAQAINLMLFVPAAAVSLIIHRKNNLISTEYLVPCLPGGIIGGIIGSLFSNFINPDFLAKLFGIFLLFIALREFIIAIKLIFKAYFS